VKTRRTGYRRAKSRKLPLLVAFFFDFYADYLHLYPRSFNQDVSGILTIKRDDATIKAFEHLALPNKNGVSLTPDGRMACLPAARSSC